MKIITCPKGGRLPFAYCQTSCLNYSGESNKGKRISLKEIRNLFKNDQRSWLQIYKEDIGNVKKVSSCGVL